MAYSLGRSAGIIVGVLISIIIVIFVLRYINTDKGVKTQYDEMQQVRRGQGYKYGFYAICIYECLMCALDGTVPLPLSPFAIHFLAILVGIVVQVTYCIWHDAYMGLNNNARRFAIFMIIVAAFNFAVAFLSIRSGGMMADGVLQTPFINLVCAVLCIVIGVELFIKKAVDAGEEE